MVDVQEILSKLEANFFCTGQVSVDPNSGEVSVTGSVKVKGRNLKALPVTFNRVKYDFIIAYQELTTLKGTPVWVGRDFNCSVNRLKTLKLGPKHVGRDFLCDHNRLKSLKYAPVQVGRSFDFSDNFITSLEHSPQKVPGFYKCSRNMLTSLDHAPDNVKALFCNYNLLTSLKGAPKFISSTLWCSGNRLQSLEGLPEHASDIILNLADSPQLPLLRLLAVQGLKRVDLGLHFKQDIRQQIIDKYLGQGRSGALLAAAELIRAGHSENARW